jgi:hypothetical protein
MLASHAQQFRPHWEIQERSGQVEPPPTRQLMATASDRQGGEVPAVGVKTQIAIQELRKLEISLRDDVKRQLRLIEASSGIWK